MSPKYDLLSITAFSKKQLKHFETCAPTDYEGIEFAKDCEKFGFVMDAYTSLREISEDAISECEILKIL